MRTRYDVYMDSLPLDAVDPAIYVTDVQETPASYDATTMKRAKGDGLRVLRRLRDSLQVRVTFMVRETDVGRRREIVQRVSAWAMGGKYLSLGDRPGQRLRVACETLPGITSALKWTQELTMVFTAYAMPYWEAETPTRASFTGKSGTAAIRQAGTAPCFLEAEISNTSGSTMTSLSLTADGQTMAFTGMALGAGKTLKIYYDDSWLLRAEVDGASVLNRRTADSADDLILPPGKATTVTIAADKAVTVTLKARGLWL
ncbi:MAG: hypothetical protein ACI4ML_11605 [Aristaeellaceae bacterium]